MKKFVIALCSAAVLSGCAGKPKPQSFSISSESLNTIQCGTYTIVGEADSFFMRKHKQELIRAIDAAKNLNRACMTYIENGKGAQYAIKFLISSEKTTETPYSYEQDVYGMKRDGTISCQSSFGYTSCQEGQSYGVIGSKTVTGVSRKTSSGLSAYMYDSSGLISQSHVFAVHKGNSNIYNLTPFYISAVAQFLGTTGKWPSQVPNEQSPHYLNYINGNITKAELESLVSNKKS